MQEKDYHSIYENFFNQFIDEYINEMEGIYKSSLEEGDAQRLAHDRCITIVSEKRIGLKIIDHPYSKLHSIFRRRNKLVQETNPNRLYTKHIISACEEWKIEFDEDAIENYTKEFAILEASQLLINRYVHWSILYEMMFDLKDFTEFKIIKNVNFPEESEIFKEYQKSLKPSLNLNENFKVIEHFKSCIENLWLPMTGKYINEDLTSFEDFKKVFFENWKSHNSKIYFSCNPEEASYFLFKLKFVFKVLSFASIHRSGLFYTREGNPFKQDNLSNQKNKIIEEEKQEINVLLDEVGLFLTD
ncbi:MAG: hypothetical protein IZT56_12715 [Bacteroidetes bacterium]|nr:hypothetical protein [Bacteroidota bacterium]